MLIFKIFATIVWVLNIVIITHYIIDAEYRQSTNWIVPLINLIAVIAGIMNYDWLKIPINMF
jgi:hypothetical protein